MKLQIAVDVADTEKILKIAEQVYDVIDIYEVGTPVIMKEGTVPIRAIKEEYPDLIVLADSKIVDGGALECEDLCKSGADIVTVLALADDSTICAVVRMAHRYKRKVLADLLCVNNITERAKELIILGVDYVGVHTGVDMQKEGRTPLKDLQELIQVIPPEKAAVAGGINMRNIENYIQENPGIIIAGSSLYRADNIRSAAIEMKGVLNKCR